MTVIQLDLKNHCIETELKHQYNRTLSRLLKAHEAALDIENQLELLLRALKTFDFGRLRSAHRALAGGSAEDDVQLRAGPAGGADLYVNGEVIPGSWKKSSQGA